MEYIATFDDTLELSLIYEDENILEMTLEESVNPGDDFELGTAPSSLLEVSLIDVDSSIIFEQEVIKPYIGLKLTGTIEYIPLGVFVVDEIKKEKRTVKLTCFDQMVKLEKPYVSTLAYPAPLNTVMQEICSQAGVALEAGNLPAIPIGDLSGYTLREAVGFIAAFMGGFARFNRDGMLEITTYADSDTTITADNYASLDTAERVFSVGRLTCYVGEDANGNPIVLTAGATGNEVYFENPIMTQTQLDSIYTTLSTVSYMPYSMQWQGNPALMAGDKITIIDAKNNTYNTLLMRQKMTYKGGLKATAEAVGKTEQAQATRTIGTITKSIDRKTQIARTAAEQYADRILKMLADGEFEGGLFIDKDAIISPIIAGLEGRFVGTVKVGENGQIVIDGVNKRIYLNDQNYWDETGIHVSSANIVGSITFAQLDTSTQTNINKGVSAKNKLDADVGANTIETTTGAQTKANQAEQNAKTYAAQQASAALAAAEDYADNLMQQLANGNYAGGTFINGNAIYSPVIAGLTGRFIGAVKVGDSGSIIIDGANKRIYMDDNNYWDNTGIHLPAANIVGKITAQQLQVDTLSAISANLGTVTAGTLQGVTIIGSTIKTAETGTRLELTGNVLRGYSNSTLKVQLTGEFMEFWDAGNTIGRIRAWTDTVNQRGILEIDTVFGEDIDINTTYNDWQKARINLVGTKYTEEQSGVPSSYPYIVLEAFNSDGYLGPTGNSQLFIYPDKLWYIGGSQAYFACAVDIDGALDVAGDVYISGKLNVTNSADTGYTGLGIGIRTANRAELHLHASGDKPSEIFFGRDSRTDANVRWSISARNGAAGAAPLAIYEGPYNAGGWYPRLVLLPGGNVGIGTENPASKLHVEGNIRVSANVVQTDGTDGFIMHPRYNATTKYDFWQLAPIINGTTDWSKGITLQRNTGYVGIGTTSPSSTLHVNGAVTLDGGLISGKAIRTTNSYTYPTIAATSVQSNAGAWVTWDYANFAAAPLIVLHRDDNNLGTKVQNITATSCQLCMAGTASGLVRALAFGGV